MIEIIEKPKKWMYVIWVLMALAVIGLIWPEKDVTDPEKASVSWCDGDRGLINSGKHESIKANKAMIHARGKDLPNEYMEWLSLGFYDKTNRLARHHISQMSGGFEYNLLLRDSNISELYKRTRALNICIQESASVEAIESALLAPIIEDCENKLCLQRP